MTLNCFSQIWLVDFEFSAPLGERPTPLCLVAREIRSDRLIRLWQGELCDPPYPLGADALMVAFYGSAELGCHLTLGWPMPQRMLDLFTEFRCITNGLPVPCGVGLLGALTYFGIDAITAVEKESMRELAMRGGIYTPAEKEALLDYCESDVDALAKLLPAMLPKVDLPRALLRGRYMAAAAHMEHNGVPIDVEKLNDLRSNWTLIQGYLTASVNQEFQVYVPRGRTLDMTTASGAAIKERALDCDVDPYQLAAAVEHIVGEEKETTFRQMIESTINCQVVAVAGSDQTDSRAQQALLRQTSNRRPRRDDPDVLRRAVELVRRRGDLVHAGPLTFSTLRWKAWLADHKIPWPQLESGDLDLSDDAFRAMANQYPIVRPLRELRVTLSQMRLNDLAVGQDGRNRCLLSAFRASTSRNQPSNSRFIFGPSCWLRSLIRPPPGRALVYIDWQQQEWGIGAALSRDRAMMNAYLTGDPYLEFAKQAGAAPQYATKATHKAVRDQFKVCALAVQYGMGEKSLAASLNSSEAKARELLALHRQTYPQFWKWSQAAVDHAMLHGFLETIFGWRIHVSTTSNARSLANFPCQANGAEMLRLACCLATERAIQVCAPIHDALLIEAAEDQIDAAVETCQMAMAEASRIVLDGFELRTDSTIVRPGNRYMDPRGEQMWNQVVGILDQLGAAPTLSASATGNNM